MGGRAVNDVLNKLTLPTNPSCVAPLPRGSGVVASKSVRSAQSCMGSVMRQLATDCPTLPQNDGLRGGLDQFLTTRRYRARIQFLSSATPGRKSLIQISS